MVSVGAERRSGAQRRGAWARPASTCLGIAYPFLAHSAVVLGQPRLVVASIGALTAALLLQPLVAGRRWATWAAVLAVLVLAALARRDLAGVVLYAPPVFINAVMAWLFGHTLLQGRTPLIERLAILMRPDGEPLDEPVRRYTAQLTAAWTALFMVMAVVNLGLALFAMPGGLLDLAGVAPPLPVSRETWSLFANLLNYVIVGAFFVVEYGYRRWRFAGQPDGGPVEFARQALVAAPLLFRRATGPLPGSARTGDGLKQAQFTVPADHPALPGHFPGRPIVPAVLLLEAVIEETEILYGPGVQVAGVPNAKFSAPLLPAEPVTLSLDRRGQQVRFRARFGTVEIMSGRLQIGGPGAAGDDNSLGK